jgi:hypothetical protein
LAGQASLVHPRERLKIFDICAEDFGKSLKRSAAGLHFTLLDTPDMVGMNV